MNLRHALRARNSFLDISLPWDGKKKSAGKCEQMKMSDIFSIKHSSRHWIFFLLVMCLFLFYLLSSSSWFNFRVYVRAVDSGE
jgi:hypothetical protein